MAWGMGMPTRSSAGRSRATSPVPEAFSWVASGRARWLLTPRGLRRKLDERLLSGGAGRGAVGDQALAGLRDVQDLALELQWPGLWVVDALEHRPADLDLVRGPHLGELRG